MFFFLLSRAIYSNSGLEFVAQSRQAPGDGCCVLGGWVPVTAELYVAIGGVQNDR